MDIAMSGSPSPRLRPLSPVEQARLQGAFIKSREEDRLFQHAGGTLYYTIDSNVVDFLVNPADRALPGYREGETRRSGFAAIFHDDPEKPAQILAEALADYLIEDLSPDTPLLIPTPLDSQVIAWQRNLVEAVARRIGPLDRSPRSGKGNFEAQAEALRRQLNLNGELTAKDEEIVAKLLQLSLLRRGTKSLERLRRLLDRRRIAVAATERERLQEPLRTALAIDFDNPRQRLTNLILTSQWHQVLGKLAPGRIRANSFDRKIKALARIEQWNDRLARMSKADPTKPAARIVFITGDSLLLEPPPSGRENESENDLENAKFRAMHLRHPRSFLPLLSMLQNTPAPRPNSEHQSVESDETLGSTGSHFLDLWASWKPAAPAIQQTTVANEIKHHWHNLLRAAVLRYKADAPKSEEFEEWQLLAFRTIHEWQEALSERYWSTFLVFGSNAFTSRRKGWLYLVNQPTICRTPGTGRRYFLNHGH